MISLKLNMDIRMFWQHYENKQKSAELMARGIAWFSKVLQLVNHKIWVEKNWICKANLWKISPHFKHILLMRVKFTLLIRDCRGLIPC